jgi:uncharacterized protein (DUF58 family)
VRRIVTLGGLAYLLLLAGLVALNGRLLALVIPPAIYLAAALFFGPEPLRLRAIRTLSADCARHGEPVTVTLSVVNEGSLLEEVLVDDAIPAGLEIVEGEPRLLGSLRPGQALEITYAVCAGRGHFDFGAAWVTASDRSGLFQRRAVLSAPAHLSILPQPFPMRRGVTLSGPLRTRGYAGPVPARVGGSGVSFSGVREYQMGDPRRWINWRVSARHPRVLFTNEFEQERIADVGLILDARSRSDIRVKGDSLFEHAIRATATLAEAFLGDGNRVGLLVYGRVLDRTFPGYGKVQREQILRTLARAQAGESQIFDRLDYLPTRFFPAQSQIVLISPLWPDDLATLLRLRAHGYQVLVVRPDPVSLEQAALGSRPEVGLAARIVRVQRALLLRQLRQAGIRVVDWRVDEPFERAVHVSLGRMPAWRRAIGVGARP